MSGTISGRRLLSGLLFLNTALFCPALPGSESSSKVTLSLQDMVATLKRKNFAVRENAEKLYQARQQIKISTGKLIPSLSFKGALGLLDGDFHELVASLVGFIYPSNWFRFKESLLYSKAHKEFFTVILANEINVVQSLYYRLHGQKSLIRILEGTLKQVEDIVRIVENRYNEGEDNKTVLLEFENLKLKLMQDYRQLVTHLKQQIFILARAVGYSSLEKWKGIDIKMLELPPLEGIKKVDPEKIARSALEVSRELKAMAYLKKAAHVSYYDRMFEFVLPAENAEGAFGFGYPSYLKIGKSNERIVDVQIDQQKSALKRAVGEMSYDLNLALSTFRLNEKGKENCDSWHEWLLMAYERGGDFEPMDYMKVFNDSLTFVVRVVSAQHTYLTERANLDRLLWKGEFYKNLDDETEQILQAIRKDQKKKGNIFSRAWNKMQHKKENKAAEKLGIESSSTTENSG